MVFVTFARGSKIRLEPTHVLEAARINTRVTNRASMPVVNEEDDVTSFDHICRNKSFAASGVRGRCHDPLIDQQHFRDVAGLVPIASVKQLDAPMITKDLTKTLNVNESGKTHFES